MLVNLQFEGRPLLFDSPLSLITANGPPALPACFRRMEEAANAGYYLAGFLSYEAGCCFGDGPGFPGKCDFPLVLMGVYRAPRFCVYGDGPSGFSVRRARLNTGFREYAGNISLIRERISSGEIYQLTYCIKLLFDFSGNASGLFGSLLRKQPVPYPAYLQWQDSHICSLSPELFFRKKGSSITTKPMKGTWRRGRGRLNDRLEYERFLRDAKNRAENVMIADLLRNDLGRIGTRVAVPRLFEIGRYATLFQMTSTVTAAVPERTSLLDLFRALFPSGSVTGAPKLRAMRLIRSIEKGPRNIYTGAIGYISPAREMFFSVPIRTLFIRGSRGEMGIGGGIVWDSTPEGEWEEGLLKARFFTSLAAKS